MSSDPTRSRKHAWYYKPWLNHISGIQPAHMICRRLELNHGWSTIRYRSGRGAGVPMCFWIHYTIQIPSSHGFGFPNFIAFPSVINVKDVRSVRHASTPQVSQLARQISVLCWDLLSQSPSCDHQWLSDRFTTP